MAEWEYTGTNQAGISVSGKIEAVNKKTAKELVNKQGVDIIKISQVQEFTWQEKFSKNYRAINSRDIYGFTKYFSIVLKAGIPVIKSLGILEGQIENIKLQKRVQKIRKDIEAGTPMWESFSKYPDIFPVMYVNLIKTGEESGLLYEMFARLTLFLEKSMALKKKVKGAMVYPMVIAFVACGVVIFLLLFVIPRFAKMFSKFGAELPLPTRLVMACSDYVQGYYIHGGIAAVVFFNLFKKFAATKTGARILDNIAMKAPLFGTLSIKYSCSALCSNLSVLLKSGLPITRAMEITVDAIENVIIREEMYKVKEDVETGTNIAEAFTKAKSMPKMVCEMIRIGDEAGTLEEMLQNIAEFYEEEVDTLVDALTSLIEPMFILVLGGIVGTIVIAMFLPIFQMSKAVMQKNG